MRKIFLLSALSALALTACDKELYDSETNPTDEPKNIADMVVPQNFDWEMTQLVTTQITTSVETAVRIYLDEKCTEDFMLAEFEATPDYIDPLVLAIPSATSKLYVKYGNTVESVAISNHVLSLTLEPAAAAAAKTRGVEDKPLYTKVIKPWSTLMFEDLFPKKGDYDFNDLVANYRTTAYYSKQGNTTKIHYIDIDFRVNAVGATLPITPYLKISNSAKNYFQKNKNKISVLSGSSASAGYEIIDNSAVSYLVLKFTGMTNKPSGVTYLNTLNKSTADAAPKLLKLRIEDHNEGTKLEDGDYFVYDFFITNGTHEIHKRNSTPLLGLGYPAGQIEGGAGVQNYSNGQNLVWAIDVPVVMKHAIEKTNFLSAYPGFYNWATSGGSANQFWYNSPTAGTLINYIPNP